MLVGRLFVVCSSGLISYIVLCYNDYYEKYLFSPLLPTLFCVIMSYFVGSFYINTISIGVDTIV